MLEELKIEKETVRNKAGIVYKVDYWLGKYILMRRVMKEWHDMHRNKDGSLKKCKDFQTDRKEKLRKCLKKMEVSWKYEFKNYVSERKFGGVNWENVEELKYLNLDAV